MDAEDLLQETGETIERVEKRTDKIKRKFSIWLENPYNKIFLAILIFAIIIRFYFFWITKYQAVWWDSADYLIQAKIFGGLIKFPYRIYAARPFFIGLVGGLLIRLGFGEIALRIIEVILSISAIPAIFVTAKTIYNKKVALISSFALAIFYLHLFLSNKLMTEVPTLTFFILAVFFFWKGYVQKNNKMLIWFGVFFGLSVLVRGGTSVMAFMFPLFLIPTDKLKFLKNKYLWIGVLMAMLVMSTFFGYYYYKEHKNPITHFLALTPGTTLGGVEGRFSNMAGFAGIKPYTDYMPIYFGKALLIPFLLGMVILLFNIIINFDLILKNKSSELKKDFFVLCWFLVPFIFQTMIVRPSMEPRYLMMAFPGFFIVLSKGLLSISDWLKKYYKTLGILTILVFLLFGAYYQLKKANETIEYALPSYYEVKQAGEWIKENSDESALVFSASEPQNIYYSERQTYNPFYLGTNKSQFEKDLYEMKPNFVVLSGFEPYMQDWMFTYPQEHPEVLIPVQAFPPEQPKLIIYKTQFENWALSEEGLSSNNSFIQS